MVRWVIVVLLVVALALLPVLQRAAYANAAAGAVTDRGVFTLTASGAAKVAAAQVKISNAVAILGAMGRVAGYVGVGLFVYSAARDVWDWYTQDYSVLDAGSSVAGGGFSWGYNNDGAAAGSMSYLKAWIGASGAVVCGALPYSSYYVTGMRVTEYAMLPVCNGQYYVRTIETWFYTSLGGQSHASQSGQTDRQTFLTALDGAVASITSQQNMQTEAQQGTTSGVANLAVATLEAARAVVSGGVALTPGTDYTQGPGYSSGSTSNPGNSIPASIPDTSGQQSVDLSPVTSAVSGVSSAVNAASTAITSAISAAESAVVSAVNAIPSAIAASGAATVSAVQALGSGVVAAVETIPAAIAASQAAVVSAVQAVAAPIVASITDAKTAIVAAIQGQPTGGGGGATEAVNNLAAADAAREKKADDKAASTSPPSVSCPVCNRADKWSDAWSTLRDAALAAPVFGLINRIAINPMGVITRVHTVHTAHYGALTFDLTAWGIDTYIGVVRYVVIFAAMIAGYFVIFG